MVPNGWEKLPLKNVAELQRGFDLPSSQRLDGEVPIVSSGGVTGFHSKSKAKSPGVVTGRYGSIGDVFYIEQDYWPLNTALWVKNFHGNYEKFIYYLLSNFDFKKFSDKTGVPGVNRNDLHTVKVNVPPLPEQKKIAQILSTWDQAISATEKLIENSQQQKKALMQQLLTGKKRLLDESGAQFDGEWKLVKVSNLLKVRKERQVPTAEVPLFSLTIEDGITPKSDRYNREFLVKNTEEKKYKVVRPKDIVYNPANLRWGAINFSRLNHSVVVSPIYEVLYVSEKDKVSLEFIAQKLMTNDQINRFAAMVEGTLVERMAVKIEPFLATKLSIPPSLKEQQAIAIVLSKADQQIELLQKKLDCLKQEKKALMQQLLTGKKRVKVTA
ncbi:MULTISPECIES: restriction endonuclease subunit S [Acinetobacter]|uniref:restriction endonuclease subunit S n=1 Tax=Acinetobacter TaxID=469 RepID=UPI000235F9A3|nr:MULTISPECIES: restriction endonuclease subunit S [Acinetobacter]KXZ75049.1 Type I restriction modification DNA specificity domain protein [Acinetobacter venetianus]GAB01441.1 type I restriction-modification system specificity subunit [Acinetobacter sp. NBRC 100985]